MKLETNLRAFFITFFIIFFLSSALITFSESKKLIIGTIFEKNNSFDPVYGEKIEFKYLFKIKRTTLKNTEIIYSSDNENPKHNLFQTKEFGGLRNSEKMYKSRWYDLKKLNVGDKIHIKYIGNGLSKIDVSEKDKNLVKYLFYFLTCIFLICSFNVKKIVPYFEKK